ncbi:MAG: NfeD family protein [Candidatus Sericytochromatia bacterium]|nr:NfeD family protein [Candidatus Tanganyikabacteria bacterium]
MVDWLHNAQAWLALAAVLLLAEILTTTFFLACLALGALAAAGSIALGHAGQEALVAFSVASVLSMLALRPFMLKMLRPASEVRTNAAAIIGQEGRVTVAIRPDMDEGRVQVGGEDWWAVSSNGEPIAVDCRILVLAVDGSKLTVRPSDDPSPPLVPPGQGA